MMKALGPKFLDDSHSIQSVIDIHISESNLHIKEKYDKLFTTGYLPILVKIKLR